MDRSFDPLEARRQVGDDAEVMREVMILFIDDTPKRVAELRRALDARDTKLLERTAHTIRGSCVIFGAAAAVDAAGRLELLARSESFEGIPEAIVRLETETARLSSDIRSYLDAAPA